MLHEHHLAGCRTQARHDVGGLRPLQRQQAAIHHLDFVVGQAATQMGDILITTGRVDHQIKVVTGVDRHQVIEDTAVFAGKQAIALHAFGQADQIRRHQGLQRGQRVVATNQDLRHVRDVEQAAGRAGMLMLFLDPQRILNGHVIARERDHLGPQLSMQGIQRCRLEFTHGVSSRGS